MATGGSSGEDRSASDAFTVVSEVARAFSSASGDVGDLLSVIAERVAITIKDYCAVLLLSADGKRLEPAAVFDPDPEALRIVREALVEPIDLEHHPLARKLLETGQPFFAPVLNRDQLRPPATTPRYFAFIERIGMHSMLMVRLGGAPSAAQHDGGQAGPPGVIVLSRFRPDSPPFDERDLELARTLADHAALALTNARLEQRMHEANRLKSEFLANMSHELRTPLNAIIGFAELMVRGKVGPMADNHREYLGDILTSSHHLLRLINDILDLAKIESGKMAFRPETVDLAKATGEVRDILRGLAAEKHISLETTTSKELKTAVLDAAKLKQVLYNYLSNALKFTPNGGKVTVEIAPHDERSFRIAVTDTGIGIKPEDMHRLFIEFQQLGVGAQKKDSGAGLGLALTKRIVESQGGTVGVTSEPGKGSTFWAVLPFQAAGPPA